MIRRPRMKIRTFVSDLFDLCSVSAFSPRFFHLRADACILAHKPIRLNTNIFFNIFFNAFSWRVRTFYDLPPAVSPSLPFLSPSFSLRYDASPTVSLSLFVFFSWTLRTCSLSSFFRRSSSLFASRRRKQVASRIPAYSCSSSRPPYARRTLRLCLDAFAKFTTTRTCVAKSVRRPRSLLPFLLLFTPFLPFYLHFEMHLLCRESFSIRCVSYSFLQFS